MKKNIVQFCYCQLIDASATNAFEKDIFEDSYNEFQLQSQAYNNSGSIARFDEMVQNNPKANSLHYKVGFAVGLYIQKLKGAIPGLVDECNNPVFFTRHEFKIIESQTDNRQAHIVAICYFTDAYWLLKNFGEYMVLAPETSDENKPILTFTLKMQPHLSIVCFADVEIADAFA